MVYAQLRVDERTRIYVYASGANVVMTVTFTVALVVFAGQGARGLLLGNFGASALVVLGLWLVLRRRFSLRVSRRDLRAMLSFGLPTVPADASVYALQVADRFYLLRFYSGSSAGLYAVALKLATVVFVAVRGFQYAWPPLAYSIESDEEAARLYSLVTTYYALATGVVVCGVALLGRWMVRLLAAPEFFGAYRALPWLALGWALYGLYLVFIVIAGRARVTSRNFPAAAAGLAVNVALLVLLVPHGGAGLGIAGAGIALCGAYVVMLAVMYSLTSEPLPRRLSMAPAGAADGDLRRRRGLRRAAAAGKRLRRARAARCLARLGAGAVAGHAASSLPTSGDQARALVADGRRRVAAFRAKGGEVEEYAEDPLKDSDGVADASRRVSIRSRKAQAWLRGGRLRRGDARAVRQARTPTR